ncbi:hypothetical protein R3P38DRAFT_2793771 [Favolaschia claudopus]|uniref:Uncharacterized protein n=1 Tax=Favolaschia claudopus TaxID=2862362 RepID=A0AAW0ACV6_9AGAR
MSESTSSAKTRRIPSPERQQTLDHLSIALDLNITELPGGGGRPELQTSQESLRETSSQEHPSPTQKLDDPQYLPPRNVPASGSYAPQAITPSVVFATCSSRLNFWQ